MVVCEFICVCVFVLCVCMGEDFYFSSVFIFYKQTCAGCH